MSVRARQRQVELPAAARLGGAGLKHACLAERSCLLFLLRGHGNSVLHFPEKSGIYHFLINFSSGMGEWYMKVVFEVLILFSLLSLISFT